MPTPIETLKSIQYSNLNQLMEDLNFNFAVLESSPLYKGIPGTAGINGVGTQGTRGIKFAFVQLANFVNKFGDVSLASQISIVYLNAKLQTFNNKNKLLQALGLTEFIDKDIVVMTDTIMLSYDLQSNTFINTGIAFNQQANLLNNLQQQIEQSINDILSTNQTLNNITNIFEGYVTIAKNYSDNNNIDVPTLTASSVYAPYIPGYNNNIGVPITNHKYFGFADSKLGLDENGTTVFGSMKKYINLMDGSYSIGDVDQTLVSDYAPGIGNIPSAVFLQDTNRNGIMFGLKEQNNFKRFGSIFKNTSNELVIKSDQGTNPSEYSQLLLHQNYLKFAKLVQFGNDLEISYDLKVFGNILNDYIRTGQFTDGANLGNQYNAGVSEIGKVPTGPLPNTITKHNSMLEKFNNYLSKVLVTTSDGTLSKDYSLENGTLTLTAGLLNFNNPNVTSSNKFITSNYLDLVIQKINNIISGIGNDYWSKSQFPSGVIPSLTLANSLFVPGRFHVGYALDFINLSASLLTIASTAIEFSNFKDKVLVTDEDGLLLTMYEIEKQALNPIELQINEMLNIFTNSTTKILTTNYYIHLATKINQLLNQIITINNTLVTIFDQISDLTDYVNYQLGLTNQSITDLENNINQQIFNLETTTNQSFLNIRNLINEKISESESISNLQLQKIFNFLRPKLIKTPNINNLSSYTLYPVSSSWVKINNLLDVNSFLNYNNLSFDDYEFKCQYRIVRFNPSSLSPYITQANSFFIDFLIGWFKPGSGNNKVIDINNFANFGNCEIFTQAIKISETGNITPNNNQITITRIQLEDFEIVNPSGSSLVDAPFTINTPILMESEPLGYETIPNHKSFLRLRVDDKYFLTNNDPIEAGDQVYNFVLNLVPKILSSANIIDFIELTPNIQINSINFGLDKLFVIDYSKTDITNIVETKVQIFDENNDLVLESVVNNISNPINVDGNTLSSGIYYIRFKITHNINEISYSSLFKKHISTDGVAVPSIVLNDIIYNTNLEEITYVVSYINFILASAVLKVYDSNDVLLDTFDITASPYVNVVSKTLYLTDDYKFVVEALDNTSTLITSNDFITNIVINPVVNVTNVLIGNSGVSGNLYETASGGLSVTWTEKFIKSQTLLEFNVYDDSGLTLLRTYSGLTYGSTPREIPRYDVSDPLTPNNYKVAVKITHNNGSGVIVTESNKFNFTIGVPVLSFDISSGILGGTIPANSRLIISAVTQNIYDIISDFDEEGYYEISYNNGLPFSPIIDSNSNFDGGREFIYAGPPTIYIEDLISANYLIRRSIQFNDGNSSLMTGTQSFTKP